MLFEESLELGLIANVSLATGGVFGRRAPQGSSYPRVVYVCGDGERDDTQDGASGLCMTEVDLDHWDRTYAGAKALARQTRLWLNAVQRGIQRPLVEGGPNVGRVKLRADVDDDDGTDEAFVVTIPATFYHNEELP